MVLLLLWTVGSLVAYLVAGKADDCCRFGSGVQPWLLAAIVVSLEVVVRLAGV